GPLRSDSMQALPLVLGFLAAALVVPGIVRALRERGFERENYRGATVAFPLGVAIPAAAVAALVPLAVLDELAGVDVCPDRLQEVAVYAFGVCLLGLVDDVFAGESRGWRGHGAAVLGGSFSTGALKAIGALGLALLALGG